MNKSALMVALLGVVLLMAMSVISFLVYDAMSEKNPYYVPQEFDVEGTIGHEVVEGTCVSSLNTHSGAGDIVLYSITISGQDSEYYRFYIYFDEFGSPAEKMYKYDASSEKWTFSGGSETFSFQHIGSKKIDNVEIKTGNATLSLKEVVN